MQFNSNLLSSIQQASSQDLIGLLFADFAPFLKMYKAYAGNYGKALKTLKQCRGRDAVSQDCVMGGLIGNGEEEEEE